MVIKSFKDIFTQDQDPEILAGCPIKVCELRTKDCKAFLNNPHFKMKKDSPWVVTKAQNVKDGHSETICYTCTIGGTTFYNYGIEVE